MLSIFFLGQLLSLGTLRDLGDNDTASVMPGIYIMPQSVESCGRLMRIEAKGFVNDSTATRPIDVYRMRFLVYNEKCSGTYDEIHRQPLIATANNDSREFSVSSNLNEVVYVNKGSLIGGEVGNTCNEMIMSFIACPFIPVIQLTDGNNTQESVLYATDSLTSLSDLEKRTGVFLNMKAIIGNNCYW